MPRPGPRSYECVRRSWHSDRHQPIRGSIIKEIFSVVHEIHSSTTKKNKEWQEKLPIVVLKAEEIMYSKASSEAEYMDLKTLWARTNDAINTIIRLDESYENGEFLQPCIEAALNLGCTPTRTSRGQRTSNTRCYFSPTTPFSNSSLVQMENLNHGNFTISSQYISPDLDVVKPTTMMNSTNFNFVAQSPVTLDNDCTAMRSNFVPVYIPVPSRDKFLDGENYVRSNSFSTHPLYFGDCSKLNDHWHGSKASEPVMETGFEHLGTEAISKKNKLTGTGDILVNPSESGCDLSLRLAPLSFPCSRAENIQLRDVKNTGCLEGCRVVNQPPILDKEVSMFSRGTAHNYSDTSSGRWSFEAECLNLKAIMRKRKAAFDHQMEDSQLRRQSNATD